MASEDFLIRIILDAKSKIAPVMAAAIGEAKKLEDSFKGTDRAAEALDRRLVQLEGHVSKARDTMRSMNPTLDAMDRKLKSTSTTLTGVNRNLGVLERNSAKAGAALGALNGITEKLEKKLNELDRKMTEMGARTYRPKLDVDTKTVEVQVEALSLQLLRLERKRRTVHIGIEREVLDREIAAVEAKLAALEGGSAARDRVRAEGNARAQDEELARLERSVRESEARTAATRRAARVADERDERESNRRRVEEVRAAGERLAAAQGKFGSGGIKSVGDFRKAVAEIEFYRRRLEELGHVRVTPKVGLSRAEFEIQRRIVEAQLRKLGLRREHIKIFLDSDRSSFDRAGAEIGSRLTKISEMASEHGKLTLGGLKNVAINAAVLFSEPLLSAITAVAGALVAVGIAAGQAAAGLAGLAAAGLAQTVPVLSLLFFAFSRLAAVVKASSLAQQERDKGAQQSVSIDKAKHSAIQGLAGAHKALADAQLRVIDAQDKLNEARRNGVRTITDLMLAEQRATLAAQRGRLGLASQIAGGGGSLIQSAQLDARSATIDANRQRVDTRRAVAGGVEGLPEVVAAKRALDDARDSVAQAREQISQATDNLAAAGAKIGAAASAYAIALSKLSAGELQLLRAVERFKKLFTDTEGPLRRISDIIVMSFARALDRVSALLQDASVLKAFKRLATGIAASIDDISKFLTTGPIRQAWVFFSDQATKNLRPVTGVLKSLVTIFLNIARAASGPLATALKDVNSYLSDLAKRTGTASGQNGLRDFFEKSLVPMRAFLHLGGSIGRLFLALAGKGGATEEGSAGIERLADTIDRAAVNVEKNGAQIRRFFKQSIDASSEVLKVVVAVGAALIKTFDPESVRLFGDFLTQVIIPVLATIVKSLGMLTRGLLEVTNTGAGKFFLQFAAYVGASFFVVNRILSLLKPLVTVLGWLWKGLRVLGLAGPILRGLSVAFWALNAAMDANPVGLIVIGIAALVAGLIYAYKHVEGFRRVVDTVFRFVKDHWKLIVGIMIGPFAFIIAAIVKFGPKLVGAFADVVGSVFKWLKDKLGGVVDIFAVPFKFAIDIVQKLPFFQLGKKIVEALMGPLKGLKNLVVGAFNSAFGWLKGAVGDAGDFLGSWMKPADQSGFIKGAVGSKKEDAPKSKKKEPFKVDDFSVYESKISPQEAKKIKALWQDIATSSDASTRKIAKSVRDMRVGIEQTLDRLVKVGRDSFRDFWRAGNTNFDRLNDSVEDSMKKFTRAIEDAMNNVTRVVYQGFEYIATAANKSLKAFTGTPVEISLAAPKKITGKAEGGMVGLPGERGADKVHTLLGRGEAVLNWAHQKVVDPALRAVYGFGLTDMFKRTNAVHGAEAPGGMARGGGGIGMVMGPGNSLPADSMVPIGGPYGGGQLINPRIADQVRALISKWHTLVTAGWAPVGTHAPNSDHHWGGGVDLVPGKGGSWPEVDRFAKWAEPAQNQPAHGFRWVGYNGDSGHGTGNHLHLSWPMNALVSGIGGAISSAAEKIGKVNIKGKLGALSTVGQGALDVVRKAAQKMLDKSVGGAPSNESTGISADASVQDLNHVFAKFIEGSKPASPALSPDQVVNVAQSVGLPGRAFEQIAHGESSYYPGVQQADPGDGNVGIGLWQLTPHAWGGGLPAIPTIAQLLKSKISQAVKMAQLGGVPQMFNPIKNAIVTKLMFDQSGLAPWYGTKYLTGAARASADPNRGSGARKAIGGFVEGAQRILGSYKNGTDYVPKTGVYELHQGEQVVSYASSSKRESSDLGSFATILRKLLAGGKAKDIEKNAKAVTDLLAELTVGQLKKADKLLKEQIHETKKGDFRDALMKVRSDLRRYLTDPITILAAELSRFQGIGNVAGILAIVRRVRIATQHIKTTTEKGLDKLSKAIDFLASDEGPFALLESQIAAQIQKRARALSAKIYKISKDGKFTRSLQDPDALGAAEVKDLTAARKDYEDEAREIQLLINKARAGLKRKGITKKEHERLTGALNNLLTRRDSVQQTLSENAASIVERREQQQSESLDLANTNFDRKRGTVDRARRINTITGNELGNVSLFDTQVTIASDQLGDLRKRLLDARSTGNNALATQIEDQIQELNTSIIELAAQKIQASVEIINKHAERGLGFVDRMRRLSAVIGDDSSTIALFDVQASVLRYQIAQLQQARESARAQGNGELVNQLDDQLQDLSVTIVEVAAQKVQAIIDQINRQADVKLTANDVQTRIAQLGVGIGGIAGLGRVNYAGVGTALQQRGQILSSQYSQISSARDLAAANGDTKIVEDLTKQMDQLQIAMIENTMAVRDNTDAAFAAAVQQSSTASDFFLSINESAQTINGALGNVSGVLDANTQALLLQQKQDLLAARGQTDRGFLAQLLNSVIGGSVNLQQLQGFHGNELAPYLAQLAQQAFASGQFDDAQQEAIRNLIQAVLSNESATIDNTAAMQSLNGSVAQTFSSTSWRLFREAIFNGSGGLLPQYQLPGMVTNGIIAPSAPVPNTTIPGVMIGTGPTDFMNGTIVPPSPSDGVMTNDTYNNYFTSPTEVLDPGWFNTVLAFRRGIDRAT